MKLCLLAAVTAICPVFASAQTAPPALKAYADSVSSNQIALAPDGADTAFLTDDDGKQLLNILPQGTGLPALVNVSVVNPKSIRWLDAHHVMLVHQSVIEAPGILPRQVISQGISYNIQTKKSATLMANTFRSVPMLTDGNLTTGDMAGRAVVFMRGLTLGPSYDLYSVDLDTGVGRTKDTGQLSSVRWIITSKGVVVARVETDSDHHLSNYRLHGSRGWRDFKSNKLGDDSELLGFGRNEGVLAFRRGSDLVEVNTEDGAVSEPLQPSGEYFDGRTLVNSSGLLTGAELTGDVSSYFFFDPRWKAGWASALKSFPGARIKLQDGSDSGRQFLAWVENFKAAGAGAFYYVDLDNRRAEMLTEGRPGLTADQVGQIMAVDFKASDGLGLRGFLTVPPGRKETGLPLVVLVHPLSSRADSYFDVEAQTVASRGYAVFNVNYRGSSGVTEALKLAGKGELGGRMQTDLSDGVAHLVSQGIVDPKRVCIMGADFEGYAGYAALAGVTLQSGIYRCAIAATPMTDLAGKVSSPSPMTYGPRWTQIEKLKSYLGDNARSRTALASLSPLHQASHASAPILMLNIDGINGFDDVARLNYALQRQHKSVQTIQTTESKILLQNDSGWETTTSQVLAFLQKENPPE